VIAPLAGTNGDPTGTESTGGGATLTVYKPGGTEKVVLTLPVAHWSLSGTFLLPRYRYRDSLRTSGPITRITLRNGRLSLSGAGAGLYSLVNAPQGSLAVRLRLGTGAEYCAVAPVLAPATTNDSTAQFVGKPNSPPPATCPPVP
jgi:hypothetical protein